MLVRSRVKPFQPTILLDGLIVSLAVGALTAVVMYAVVLRDAEASTAVLALKLTFPLCAAMLLAFSIWVIALIGWKPNRMWITTAIGLALAMVASAFFVVQIVHGDYAAGSVLDSLWLGAGTAARVRGLAAARRRPAGEARGLAPADRDLGRGRRSPSRCWWWASSCRSALPR